MRVVLAEDPLGCVVRGTGKVLNELDALRRCWWIPTTGSACDGSE